MKHFCLLFCFVTVQLFAQNYPIGTRSVTYTDPARSNRSIAVDFYYPATAAGANQSVAADSFGLVVFGHGFVISTSDYAALADTLAKRGYIVALANTETSLSPNHSNFAQDLVFLVNKITSEGFSNPASPFYGKVRKRSAIGGHSMGGGATVLSCSYSNPATCYFTFGAANTNPSCIAVARQMTKPYLDIAGIKDCVAPPSSNQIPMYDSSGSSCKYYIGLANATHCQFAASSATLCYTAEGLVSGCASAPYLSWAQQQTQVLNYLLPWLQYYLKADCDAYTNFQNRFAADAINTKRSSCNVVVPALSPITGSRRFCRGSNTVLSANPSDFSYQWSNGKSTLNDTISVAGNYSVTVSNGTCNRVPAPVSVLQDTVPGTPTWVTQADTVCANVEKSIAAVAAGATSFQWSLPTGWTFNSDSTLSTILVYPGTQSGNASVTGSNYCGTSPSLSAPLTVRQPVGIAPISGADSVCEGTVITYSLSANQQVSTGWRLPAGYTLVKDSANTIQVRPSPLASAPLVAFAVGRCNDTAFSYKNIAVTPKPVLAGAVSAVDSICKNQPIISVSVTPSGAAISYQWQVPTTWNIISGSGTNSITVNTVAQPGIISVSANNSCGSGNLLLKSVAVSDTPQPVIVWNNGYTCTTAGTYQWYKDGVALNGETAATYQPAAPGSYSVAVTNQAGCVGRSAASLYQVGIRDLNLESIDIHPNPFDAEVVISFSEPVSVEAIELITVTGQRMWHQNVMLPVKQATIQPDVLKPGIYLLKITTASGVLVQRLVKQ